MARKILRAAEPHTASQRTVTFSGVCHASFGLGTRPQLTTSDKPERGSVESDV